MNAPIRHKKSANAIDVHVGSRVRLRRMMLGLSQEKLGEHLGITFQQIQKYEKGTNRIGASRLQAIARVLSVPVAFFFEDAPGSGGEIESTPMVDVTFDAATLEITRLVQAMTPEQRHSIRQIARTITEAAAGGVGVRAA
jgi:transcriptional regulator with XRE-family HTH domain